MVDLKLTKRQQEIFEFIKRYSSEHGYPPTVRDIGVYGPGPGGNQRSRHGDRGGAARSS